MRRATLLVLIILLSACGSAAPSPAPSLPPIPAAPAGWTSLASVGGDGGPGFAGILVDVDGSPLALNVACAGPGSLVVAYGPDGASPAAGEDALVVPCSTTTTAIFRELPDTIAAGKLEVKGAVLEGLGDRAPTVFQVDVEQALP